MGAGWSVSVFTAACAPVPPQGKPLLMRAEQCHTCGVWALASGVHFTCNSVAVWGLCMFPEILLLQKVCWFYDVLLETDCKQHFFGSSDC